MKIHKFADKKKEFLAIGLVSLIVILVSVYVIYLVHNLTQKVYRVFDQSRNSADAFAHFDFKAFDELGLGGTSSGTPAVTPATTTASTTASSS